MFCPCFLSIVLSVLSSFENNLTAEERAGLLCLELYSCCRVAKKCVS